MGSRKNIHMYNTLGICITYKLYWIKEKHTFTIHWGCLCALALAAWVARGDQILGQVAKLVLLHLPRHWAREGARSKHHITAAAAEPHAC
jgi:hypothetical protein